MYYLTIICLSLKIIDYEIAVYSFVLNTSISFKIYVQFVFLHEHFCCFQFRAINNDFMNILTQVIWCNSFFVSDKCFREKLLENVLWIIIQSLLIVCHGLILDKNELFFLYFSS